MMMFRKQGSYGLAIILVLIGNSVVNASCYAKQSELFGKPSLAAHNTALLDRNNNHVHKNTFSLVRGGDNVDAVVTADAPQTKTKTTTMKYAIISGIVLAFNSGFMNGCFLSGAVAPDGTKQAVSAVTGAWTTSAVGLANGNYDQFLFQFKMIISYITGSTTASIINPFPKPFELYPTKYATSFLLGSALLTMASYSASHTKPGDTRLFFYLAAIANGLQNSVTSTHTSNLCRTAHFSGISSDIGTFLGQVLRGNTANLVKLKVFVGLGVAFFTGGVMSFFATQQFQSQSLLFCAALYFAIGLSFFIQK